MLNREVVSNEVIEHVIDNLKENLKRRINKKGPYGFISRHEIIGILLEEFEELTDAVRIDGMDYLFKMELMDVAVACIFGIASMEYIDK